MDENYTHKKPARISSVTIISFLSTISLCALIIIVTIINRSDVEKLTMEQLIMEKSMKLDSVLSRLLYKTEALGAIIVESGGKTDNFERIAPSIVDDPAVLNVLMAPNGVVSKVHPLEGNEAVIGLDFFKEGAGNREAVLAKVTGRLVVGGPFELVQGGHGLVGRMPVYIESYDNNPVFWGIVSVTLKYPEALKDVGLDAIEKNGLSYIIWRINPDNNEKQIIANGEKYNHKHLRYIEKNIKFLNASWYFRIAPIRVWYEYPETWIMISAALCVSFAIAYFVQSNINLKRTKSILEKKMHESEQLAQELNQAKEQIEQASQVKSHFLANINHEMRTPMSGIIGFAELATDDNVEPTIVKDYLFKIKNSAEGLLGIIDDILDITKIEFGKVSLEYALFNLHEIFTVCGTISNLKATEKNLDLSVSIEPPVTKKIIGDPTKLRQILLNLMSNAVKFTDEGYVSLKAKTSIANEKEIIVNFEVKDSGIGLSAKDIEYIFEPFTQLDVTMTKKNGGSGLGLAIAKNLLEIMGSTLNVESNPGKGSTFSFTLKFELSEYPVDEPESKADIKYFKGNVLVCEDNETNQIVMEQHLNKAGLDAIIVPDGKQGVDMALTRMLEGNPFDLIFMDIHMPIMDGLQAAKSLRAMGSETPIIALTANMMSADLEIYKENGIYVYLAKPFKAKELRECLLKFLDPVEADIIIYNKKRKADQPIFNVIDKKLGLQQYEDDEKIYKQVLEVFAKNNLNTLNNLKGSINSGNIHAARHIVHSLKGAAGTIGASRLVTAAHNLENLFSVANPGFAKTVALTEQMKLFEAEFRLAFDELQIAVQFDSPNMPTHSTDKNSVIDYKDAIDRKKTLELIDKLYPFVESGDTKSLEYLDEIEELFQPIADIYKQFIIQMEHYDFELAYETLKSIQQFMR